MRRGLKNSERSNIKLGKLLSFKWYQWVAFAALVLFLLFGDLIVPLRLFVAVLVLSTIALGFVLFILLYKKKELTNPNVSFVLFLGIILMCASVEKGFVYSFVDEPFLPFWEISLVVGGVLGGFSTYVTFKKNENKHSVLAKLGFFLVMVCILTFLLIPYISHMNYFLDFDAPETKTAYIEEKEIKRYTKSPDSHIFKLDVDGKEIELEVDWLEYEKYEEGDKYTFRFYKGAFGVPFYISS